MNEWLDFKTLINTKIEESGIDINKDATVPVANGMDSEFELQIFINYDICNFTEYKTKNPDWLTLLTNFVNCGINGPSEFPAVLWKFSGDALTFHKRIQSFYEISYFVEKADDMLKWLETKINEVSSSQIYIKAAIWISGFYNNTIEAVNNIKFKKSVFGQEFVGENIDEGFRLCSCAKADVLTVDPKIVYILNLLSILGENLVSTEDINEKDIDRLNLDDEIKEIVIEKLNNFKNETVLKEIYRQVSKVNEKIYFMEFHKCKGVWQERAYPIFWYVDDISHKNFIYDEVVGSKSFYEHNLYRLSMADQEDERKIFEIKNTFSNHKNSLFSICKQVNKNNSLKCIINDLLLFPETSFDEGPNDSANLYYMIATVLVEKGKDIGVLIFKRRSDRVHLKNVWDFVPVKHPGNVVKKIDSLFYNNLNIDDSLKPCFSFHMDDIRGTLKPLTLCNIFRNGKIHNGLLCVSELKIPDALNRESILSEILKCAQKSGYSDVKVVEYANVKDLNKGKNWFDIDDIRIRALDPEEVSADSNNVVLDSSSKMDFTRYNEETDFGISYLGISIKEILESRSKYE